MKTKHTPGPWKAKDREIYTDHDGQLTPYMVARTGLYGLNPSCDGAANANAALIAAAPDLLAVAQSVANIGEYRELVEKMAEVLRPHERESFVKLFRTDARAAIAKAEGR